MLSKDEIWEIMRCLMSLPLSPEQIDWLLENRARGDYFEEVLRCAAFSS